MALREVDAISDATIETEREIAGEAWGQEDTERADASGERSLEEMGDGLEGQHEAEEGDDLDGEETDENEESEAEVGEEEAEAAVAATGKKPGEGEPEPKPVVRGEQRQEGHVPPGKLREANDRARALQTELDTFKTKDEQRSGEFKSLTEKLDLALRQIDDLRRGPRQDAPKPATAEAVAEEPDIFENPKGFVDNLKKGFQTELNKVVGVIRENAVATSFEIAHTRHADAFPKAMEAINKLNPQNPEDRALVQRIYNAPNPGEALVSWHKRSETLREVGDDPAAFRERVANETREALMKDPEFKKQLIAELRGDAARGDNGAPRTTTRLPPNMHRVPGSNVSNERGNSNAYDGSDSAVAASAWD